MNNKTFHFKIIKSLLMLLLLSGMAMASPLPKGLKAQKEALQQYLAQHPDQYNQQVVFLIYMKLASGNNRFFVYDLKQDQVIDQGLVAHGSGSETGRPGELKFSNVNNSLATSLGKYAIGKAYQGQFGKAYKLNGLDVSNSNAFMRNIVLHEYHAMPYAETNTPICNSYGCPMVNKVFYQRLQKIIDKSDKKIILHIYY